MTIYLGADHGGFPLKEKLKEWLTGQGLSVQDCGAFTLEPTDDYPDFAFAVTKKLANDLDPNSRGILLCRSGAGMVIAANRSAAIRAVQVNQVSEVQHAREHNDANVIGLAADSLNEDQAKELVTAFLQTEVSSDERHHRRIAKMSSWQASQ
jgi:ribose 5-phosphate isomerase B